MSNRTLQLWYSGTLTSMLCPERSESRSWALDRWLAALLGSVSLHLGQFERRRRGQSAERVIRNSAALEALSPAEIAQRLATLRASLLAEGCTQELVEHSFALVREMSGRTLGKRHHKVQIMGGLALLNGCLVEMATGEGKTLTALLPVVTAALAGVPVHVVTVNDYLAQRDAQTLKPAFDAFGLSVGVVTHKEADAQRRGSYDCDITYCVNKDLVFDYLRDDIDSAKAAPETGRGRQRQRGLFFALIDEADSVLIDEARTPLVIARELPDATGLAHCARALDVALRLQPVQHYQKDEKARTVHLTDAGRDRVTALMKNDPGVWTIAKVREERVELALTARLLFRRGEQYVVRDAKVQIVDEFTGRILPDRTWERGLHQMIELMENCKPTLPRETIARQTYPRFFARYLRIAGMTGTGAEVAGELSAQYGLRVVRVATNRPCLRQYLGSQTFVSAPARWSHVATRATHMAALGRAVLIGTRSVEASEIVAAALAKSGADFVVLNALQDEREAEVVADAGQPGRITVATNMAGRGTDIALHPQVKAAGGLHVILTEFHESARVDRQLYGRAARQGDPGSYEACVSLDDELFTTHARFELAVLRRLFGGAQALGPRVTTLLRWRAQARAERRNAAIRRSAIDNDRRSSDNLAFAGAKE